MKQPPAPRRRRRRARRVCLSTLFVTLGVAVAWLSVLPALLRGGLLRGTIEEQISALAGRPVRIGRVNLPDARTFEATRVELAGVSIDRLRVRFDDIAPLGDIVEVEADGVRARVDVTEQLIRDLLSPGAQSKPEDASLPARLPRIVVRNASLDGSVADEPMSIRDGAARLDADGAFAITGRLVTSPDPAIDIRGTLDGARVRFERIKFATLSATGEADAGSARLEIETVAIPKALAKLVEKFTGVRSGGRLAGRFALAGPRLEGRLRFEDVAVAGGDFEATRVEGAVDFDVTRSGSTWDGRARATITRAELLQGELYTEIDAAGAVELTLDASFDPPGRLDMRSGRLAIANVGPLDFSGHAVRIDGGLAYDVSVTSGNLAAKAIAERIASVFTLELSMDGALGVNAKLTGRGADFVLDARARFAGVSAKMGNVAITGLDGELPLILGGQPREGRGDLRFEELSPAPGVTFGRQEWTLIARVDELLLPQPVWFAPWGGRALVVDTAITDLRGQPGAACTLEVRDVDLTSVLAAFGSARRIAGRASLERGRVLASRAQVTLASAVSLEVFEGAAQLSNVRVVQPLDGTHRAISASLNAQGLRLKSVCETLTEFGLIDGIVDVSGSFELHHTGLPNWMQLLVRSTPRRGVPQHCDLRAVHALARLMGQPAVAEQLDRLPANRLEYDRLGFYAAMDVDFTFYLRGLWFKPDRTGEFVDNGVDDLKRGKRPPEPGLEYLMIGSGINMNIANPGGAIDFNDMLERFRKVSR